MSSNRSHPCQAIEKLCFSCPVQAGRFNRIPLYVKAISYCNSLLFATLVHARTHSTFYSSIMAGLRVTLGYREKGSLQVRLCPRLLKFYTYIQLKYVRGFLCVYIYIESYILQKRFQPILLGRTASNPKLSPCAVDSGVGVPSTESPT